MDQTLKTNRVSSYSLCVGTGLRVGKYIEEGVGGNKTCYETGLSSTAENTNCFLSKCVPLQDTDEYWPCYNKCDSDYPAVPYKKQVACR